MRCNLTEAEQKAALEVPFRCTGEEQEFIERCFIGYLFFEHEADENGRLGVTTECTRCGRKVWWTEREWKRFKQENDVKARSNLLCPDCGCGVTLYPRGKLRNGKALDEYRQVVLLRAIDGALRAVALGVWKHHGRWGVRRRGVLRKGRLLLRTGQVPEVAERMGVERGRTAVHAAARGAENHDGAVCEV